MTEPAELALQPPLRGHLGDRDAALRQSAQAYLKSLLYDEEGRIYGSASKTEFDLLIAKLRAVQRQPRPARRRAPTI